MEENQQQTEQKKSRNTLYLIVIGILTCLCGVLTWQYLEQKKRVEFITVEIGNLDTEKLALDFELNDMIVQYDGLETNNAEMRAKIEIQKDHLEELIEQAEKHKDDAYIIYKLRKETQTLRRIMKGFVHTIDSINMLNVKLRAEKAEMKEELGEQKEAFTKLEEKTEGLKEQVKIGARLEAKGIMAVAQRLKKSGIHRETTKAERAEKLKCCFTLSENQLALTGTKEIYLRIIDPKGNVLCLSEDEENMFDFNGVRGLYSVRKQVIYDATEMYMCLYWNVIQQLSPGEYIVEAYSDGADIGRTSLFLD